MGKRDLLKLPDDLEGNLRALLRTPPPPHDVPGSRKAAPKPPAKPKAPKRYKRKTKAAGVQFEYEQAPVLKEGQRAKKKGTKKR